MPIPVFKPSIKRRDMHSVLSCLVSDVPGPGMVAQDLAASVADAWGFAGGLALREHSRAVELALAAAGLNEGAGLALSPLGPMAHGTGLQARRLKPVFIDVNTDDACIDTGILNTRMTADVKAVLVHAPMGLTPDMETIYSFGLPVIADAGEAPGAGEGDGFPGSKADLLILPMEADAIVTAGGGTLLLARSKSTLTALKTEAEKLAPDAFMPDINASLGIVQWREREHFLEDREAVFKIYLEALRRGRHRIPVNDRPAVPYSFPVILASGVKEVSRYAVRHGVETTLAFAGCMLDSFPDAGETCPNARALALTTILFPLYPTLGKKNVQLVAKVLSTLP